MEGTVPFFGGDKVLCVLYDNLDFAFVANYALIVHEALDVGVGVAFQLCSPRIH